MKSKKVTSKTPAQMFNEMVGAIDDKIIAYEELVAIRERVLTGGMTTELYAFLNAHEDLNAIFTTAGNGVTFPESAMEALDATRVKKLDVAIEGILADIVKFIKNLWNKFCDWIMDWVDTNRRLKFRLQRHLRRYKESSMNYGGDHNHYLTIKGDVFNYETQWLPMYNAVVNINALLAKVPANDPAAWFEDNFNELKTNLAVFGWELNTAASKYHGVMEDRGFKMAKQHGVQLISMKWDQSNLGSILSTTIKLLETEEQSHSQFVAVKRAFDRAVTGAPNIRDIAALKRLLRICKKNKDFAAICARAVNDVCNIILNAS